MADTLPPAEWTQRDTLAALVRALGSGHARWVGGAVRDTLVGKDVQDIDAATPLPPHEVIVRLQAAGIRTIPTGLKHGTVTAILDDGTVEITTLRKDIATDGRHAEVQFASDWKEDAARRDFTINALYADPVTLELFDYFGGRDDLATQRVRFIGDARTRIAEDYLRILRYFRFQARFGAKPDAIAEEACSALAGQLAGLSRERVGWELLNLLGLPDPAETVARMHTLGVLPVVLPECGQREITKLRSLITTEQAASARPDALRRLAALLPALPAVAASTASRLRLSRAQQARIACVAERTPADVDNPRALAYNIGKDCAIDRLLLAGADIASIQDWEIPEFPLNGGAIIARGIKPGPQVSAIQSQLEDQWVAEGFPDKARVSAILDTLLAQL
ncbi:CCA tRNA nucleotidyltransferase [Altererythrobacter aquiaggeris]|uniref:CCA tRNA nucleotidyltransferase n=1 Tax=Aestuarierythrobacter aquiaggeris TaxID=1898396 RepID=UPI003019DB2D